MGGVIMKLEELAKRIADKKAEKKSKGDSLKAEVQKAKTIADLKTIIIKLLDDLDQHSSECFFMHKNR